MLSKRQRRLEPLLERVAAQRLKPPCLGAEPRRTSEPVQRRTSPEGQRALNGVRPGTGIAFPQGNARLPEQLLEPQGAALAAGGARCGREIRRP